MCCNYESKTVIEYHQPVTEAPKNVMQFFLVLLIVGGGTESVGGLDNADLPAQQPTSSTNATGSVVYEVNLSPASSIPWSRFYSESVSAGHIGLASRADYRSHMAMVAKHCGFK